MSTDPSHAGHEIARQPAAWTRAVDALATCAPALPRPGERVAVIGCGTSWFMATAYAALRESAPGVGGETDAFAASQWPRGRRYDRLLVISRSGTTTEVLEAVADATMPVTAITAVPDGPLATAATETVALDFADELSVVQTVFATTTLMLLRASLGESVDLAVRQAAAVLDSDPDTGLDAAGQYTFVGQGWASGVASEAALKLREASRSWTESYPQMEYRHGPISVAEPGRVVWVFGPAVPGLRDDIAVTGATLVDDDLDPVADLVRAQLLAVRRARARGYDPDLPRHLTRSVVLSAPGAAR
jgi:fructoselysine-6-P-deglycase FrlB-like protein